MELPQELKLLAGVTLPGETVIAAAFKYAEVHRATMSQENRDRLDALNVKAYEWWLKLVGIA